MLMYDYYLECTLKKKYYSCKNMHQVYLTYIYLFYHNNQLLYNLYIFITQTITFAKICIFLKYVFIPIFHNNQL